MISPVKIWRNQKKIQQLLRLTGKIVSYTRVCIPPAGFEFQAPYIVVLVKLDKGHNYTAQLVDWSKENIVIGQKVMAILRRTKNPGEEGVIPYGIKFKPIK